ncbi:MAG: hypothetical protein FJW31_15470 [Acidobacteria bacterium]|nr:hypothetical protein [Acidobacteriota bacterium]
MRRRTALLLPAASAFAAGAPALAPLDYGHSFLSGVAEWNRVRFWVESRTRIIDMRTGAHEDFLQCASCKSEDTFGAKDLFLADNYDFLPIFGPTHGVIFRRKAAAAPVRYRDVRPSNKMWDGQTMRLRVAKGAKLLTTTAAIRRATHAGNPLVAQTEFANESAGLRAIIEFPVKTMNIHDAKDLYQVDTGPVAFPDLSRRWESLADSISLAFAAFNAPGFTDFILETETAIAGGAARVEHYSKRVTVNGVNRLFALPM